VSATIETADIEELFGEGDAQLKKLQVSARAHFDVVHKDYVVSLRLHLVTVYSPSTHCCRCKHVDVVVCA